MQGASLTETFTEVTTGLGFGYTLATAWQPLAARPLLIMVGVTGVGKSTTLAALGATNLAFSLLPDRRELTDRLIITYLQQQDGEPVQPVSDRKTRFAYTRRYREQFAGGMSHALYQLQVDSTVWPNWLIFDGLRGAEEVTHACQLLPQARFVVLDAPDLVRVQRLLGRNDAFDRITSTVTSSTTTGADAFAALGIAEGDPLFTLAEVQQLLQLAAPPLGKGNIDPAELRAKLQIVVEERRNYDPQAAIAILQHEAAARTLHIDTTKVAAVDAAQQIAEWIKWQPALA